MLKRKPTQHRFATAGIFSRAKPRKRMTSRQIARKWGGQRARYCGWLKRRRSMPQHLK